MNILITGGGGGIAQAIKEALEFYIDNETKILSPSSKQLDITDSIEVSKFMEIYQPETIINAAGYIVPEKIEDSSEEEFLKHFIVNVIGLFNCAKYGKWMGCKTIINIGSTSAFEGREKWGAYCASKAAAASLIETLAKEGMQAYSIHPARTATKMRERLFSNEDKDTLMPPSRVAFFVLDCLDKEFKNGSHIIVKKDHYYVIPSREVLK